MHGIMVLMIAFGVVLVAFEQELLALASMAAGIALLLLI
jgi:hypothetical protein